MIIAELPELFYAEIFPKLDLKDTCNLARVNKAYNDAVWSVDGVRSMKAKMDTYNDLNPYRYPAFERIPHCLLYTSPSPRDKRQSRMPSSA